MKSHTASPWQVRLNLESLSDRVVPSVTHFFAVGEDIGGSPIVQVFDEKGDSARTITPYDPSFTGGVRVATGDVTGDGIDDIVTAAGAGGGPHVKVFDGATGQEIRSFYAYGADFHGGVSVAVGDVTGDGFADIVTGAGPGGGPHVKVFDGRTGAEVQSFYAYDAAFSGGVSVAAGDVNGDGRADIATGAGAGGGPHVKVFDGATGGTLDSFFAYDANFHGGVSVAVGDVTGDGHADIVTGAGAGGGPHVKVFDGMTATETNSFYAYDPNFHGGVAVDVAAVNGSYVVLVAPGPSLGGFVELFDGATAAGIGEFEPFPSFKGGITTGQGMASPAAPFSPLFANPRALTNVGQSPGQSPDDSPDPPTGNSGSNDFPSDNGFIYNPPDMGYTPPDMGYTPPDAGYTPPSDSGYTPSDDSGYSPDDSGYIPSDDCGC